MSPFISHDRQDRSEKRPDSLVMKLGWCCLQFTAEELACVQILGEVFGKGWLDHTLAVLTHGDELEEEDATLEDFLADSPSALQVTHCFLRFESIWGRGRCLLRFRIEFSRESV